MPDPRNGIMRWVLTADLNADERAVAYRLLAQAGRPQNLVLDLGDTPEEGAERLRNMEREDPRSFERMMEALFSDAADKAGLPGVIVDRIPSVQLLRAFGSTVSAELLRAPNPW
jgi:hypothetical protein